MSRMMQAPELSFKEEYQHLGFEIRRLDYFLKKYPSLENERPHRLQFYVIIFPTQGSGKQCIDFKFYDYEPHDILLVGKGQVNKWVDFKGIDGYIVIFTPEFLYENQKTFKDLSFSYPYNSLLNSPKISLKDAEEYDSLVSLLGHIHAEYHVDDHSDKNEIIQCLLRAFFLKIRHHSQVESGGAEKGPSELFIRFQQALDQNLSKTRNAADYCESLNVSYRELNDACKSFTQKTVKTFIDDIVILKSRKYLMDADRNVSDACYLLGFGEISNFSKFFKKHTGQSPREFVASVR